MTKFSNKFLSLRGAEATKQSQYYAITFINFIMLTEQEKIRMAKAAFEKFADTVARLLIEHRAMFEEIMEEVTERKTAEHRSKIKDIYNSKKNNY